MAWIGKVSNDAVTDWGVGVRDNGIESQFAGAGIAVLNERLIESGVVLDGECHLRVEEIDPGVGLLTADENDIMTLD
jgi:hypothetical protein